MRRSWSTCASLSFTIGLQRYNPHKTNKNLPLLLNLTLLSQMKLLKIVRVAYQTLISGTNGTRETQEVAAQSIPTSIISSTTRFWMASSMVVVTAVSTLTSPLRMIHLLNQILKPRPASRKKIIKNKTTNNWIKIMISKMTLPVLMTK